MSNIKFKIINKLKKEWEYFGLPFDSVLSLDVGKYDEKSISRFIERYDVNNKEIYEHDIIEVDCFFDSNAKRYVTVKIIDGVACISYYKGKYELVPENIKVIGNVFDINNSAANNYDSGYNILLK